MKLLMTVIFAVHHIWCSIAAGIPVTTVCIEIKSVDPYVEPYFMCKGAEFPQVSELAYGQDSYGSQEHHNTDAGIFNSPIKHAYKPLVKPPVKKLNYHEPSSSSNYDDKSNYNHHQTKPSYQSPSQQINYNKDKANNENKLYPTHQNGKEYLNSHPDDYSNTKYSDVDLLPSFNKLDYNTPSKYGSKVPVYKDSSSAYGGSTTHSALKLPVPNSEDNGPSSKYDGYRNFITHQDAEESPYASKFPTYTNDPVYLRSEPPSITNFYSQNLYEDQHQNRPLQSVVSHQHQNSFINPPYNNNDDYYTPVQPNYSSNVPTKIENYYKKDSKLNQNPGIKESIEYYSAPKSSYALPSTTKYPLDHLSPMADKYYGKTSPKTVPIQQSADHGDYQSKSILTPQHSTQDGSPRSISKYRQELSTGNGHKITSHIETHYNNQPYDFRSIEPSYMQVPIINHEFHPDIRSYTTHFSNGPQRFEFPTGIDHIVGTPHNIHYNDESVPIHQQFYHPSHFSSAAARVPDDHSSSYHLSNQQCPNNYVYSMQPSIIPVPCYNPTPVYNLPPLNYHNLGNQPSIGSSYTPFPIVSKSLVTESPINDISYNKDKSNANKNQNHNNGNDQQRHFVTVSQESSNADSRTVSELLSSTTEKISFTTTESKSTSEMDYSMKKVPKSSISLGKKADNFNTAKRNENKA